MIDRSLGGEGRIRTDHGRLAKRTWDPSPIPVLGPIDGIEPSRLGTQPSPRPAPIGSNSSSRSGHFGRLDPSRLADLPDRDHWSQREDLNLPALSGTGISGRRVYRIRHAALVPDPGLEPGPCRQEGGLNSPRLPIPARRARYAIFRITRSYAEFRIIGPSERIRTSPASRPLRSERSASTRLRHTGIILEGRVGLEPTMELALAGLKVPCSRR